MSIATKNATGNLANQGMPPESTSSGMGVGGRLFLAFFGISTFAVLAAAAAMYAFWANREAFDRVTEHRVPSALDSLELSRQAERIVAAAPALLTVDSPQRHKEISKKIQTEVKFLNDLLASLSVGTVTETQEYPDKIYLQLASAVTEMGENLTALDQLVAKRLIIAERKSGLVANLAHTHTATQKLLAPWLLTTEAKITKAQSGIGDSSLTQQERETATKELASAVTVLRILQDVQVAATTINDTLLHAETIEEHNRLQVFSFRLNRSLGDTRKLIEDFHPKLSPLIQQRLDEYSGLAMGEEGIPTTRKMELDLLEPAERLLAQNAELSKSLTDGVDALVANAKLDINRAREQAHFIQSLSMSVLLIVVALALLSSVLIVWRYVGRNLVRRLIALNDSMLAIAGGNLEVGIPTGGTDEIAKMAAALTVFRDTAVEVRETNLREISEARRRLTDAIESISEGFSLFDADDRLIVRNSRFAELYPGLDDVVQPGVTFEEIVRAAEGRQLIGGDPQRVESRISDRLRRHRQPAEPFLQPHKDGHWIQISERNTRDRGTVAVYTDVTELKRLEEAASMAREQAEMTLTELKLAQSSLVQAEKLAQLGQLVAGIAHELKNPLNFVKNFAEVSEELIEELQTRLRNWSGKIDTEIHEDMDELMTTLVTNIGKIREHGLRADKIIRSMLAHSRGGPADWRNIDINALVDESANLAYHGARATDSRFEVALEYDLDQNIRQIDVVPQEISRVFLNLLSNAFDAIRKRKHASGDSDYRPLVKVTSRELGSHIEVGIRDNGAGIADEVKQKIFTPFFTTKPVGEGTGLGLSLSYDIVVHEHQGQLTVDSQEGVFTEFVVSLPRKHHAQDSDENPPQEIKRSVGKLINREI